MRVTEHHELRAQLYKGLCSEDIEAEQGTTNLEMELRNLYTWHRTIGGISPYLDAIMRRWGLELTLEILEAYQLNYM